MNSVKLVAFFSFILLIVFACKEGKKTSELSQMKRVLAIHDEVMPKMGSFGKLVGELSSKEDSTAIGLQYKSAREELQAAHKSMMAWMQGFGNRFDSDEILNGKDLTPTKQQWLDQEEVKIKAIRDKINTSLKNAETLLMTN